MAINALHSAASGLSALSTQIDVIANNLANVNTVGFKRSRVNFEDLLYEEKAQPGVRNANNDERPTGTYVGLGTRVTGTQLNFTQGPALATGRQLDVTIAGDGFFQVNVGEASETGFAYTRAGNFIINSDGNIVLGNTDGRLLEPAISIDEETQSIQITSDGRVNAIKSNGAEIEEVGQIKLVTFINPAGLIQIGGNLYLESEATGPPIEGNPGEGQFGTLKTGFLENSNVDPVIELVDLIKAQRAFELNSQTIQAADEALQVIANLRRF